MASEPLYFVCLFITILMLSLPDAFGGFLTAPEDFGHFLMLHYTSYCFMLLVDSP